MKHGQNVPILDSELRYAEAQQADFAGTERSVSQRQRVARTYDFGNRLDQQLDADQDSHNSSKTARSSASTVEIPGRRRLQSPQPEVLPPPASAAPSERTYSFQTSPDDNSESNSSEAPSELEWSSVSDLSDQSYFHQSPSRASASSEGLHDDGTDYSWGQSRLLDRGTESSITSFFSVGTDTTEEDSIYRKTDVRTSKL